MSDAVIALGGARDRGSFPQVPSFDLAADILLPTGHRRDVFLHGRVSIAFGYLRVAASKKFRRFGLFIRHALQSPSTIGRPSRHRMT